MDTRMVVSTDQEAKGILKISFKARNVVYSHVTFVYDVPSLSIHIFTPNDFNTTWMNSFEGTYFGLIKRGINLVEV